MSSLSNAAGAAFNKQDRKALAERAMFSFRKGFGLIKSVASDDGARVSESTLQTKGKKAQWVEVGKHEMLPLLGLGEQYYFESQSGHYAIQREANGTVRVYDAFASKPFVDPWLEKVSKGILSRDDLRSSQVILTDDLDYLVLLPEPIYTFERNGDEQTTDEFTIDGKTSRRKNHFVVYHRPSDRPIVGEGINSPTVAVTAFRKLLLLDKSAHRLELHDLENRVVWSHRLTSDEQWLADCYVRADENRLIFSDGPRRINGLHRPDEGLLKLAIWNSADGELSQYFIRLADLFELKEDGYYPKKLITIEK